MFDDETQKQIAAQAMAALRSVDAIQGLAQLLAQFRVALVNAGFSTDASEGLAQDYFRAVLDAVRDATVPDGD